MRQGISLDGDHHDVCNESPERGKECREKHTIRAGKATLEIAVDVHTDFECKTEE